MSSRAWRTTAVPVRTIDRPDDGTGQPRCPCRRGSRASTWRSWSGRSFNAHYPALFLGGFLFFLGFARATAPYQGRVEFKTPLLVGFFLAGLVIHGGLQGWWIAPVLGSLSESAAVPRATVLTAFNDNALITYLATLVPNLATSSRPRSCKARSPAAA